MAGQVTVTGHVEHFHMLPEDVYKRVHRHFPKAQLGGDDFFLPLTNCEVQFFCSSTTSLQFTISVTSGSGRTNNVSSRTVTAIETLVRATDTLWSSLEGGLKKGAFSPKARLVLCSLEDPHSLGALLVRDLASPLRSPGAKVAWFLSAFLIAVAIGLTWWQTSLPATDGRTQNLLGIWLGAGVGAISIPVPILINWRDWKKELVWKYTRAAKR